MLEILSAIFGGGATGLLGGVLTKIFDYYTNKQRLEQLREQWKHEEAMLEKESQRDVLIAKQEAVAKIEAAEAEAMAESFRSDKASYSASLPFAQLPPSVQKWVAIALVFVDFVRGITRPGLTIYLCAVSTYFYIKLQQILAQAGTPISAEQAFELSKMIVVAMLYLTTTAVGWWFASRTKLNDIIQKK